MPLTDRAIKAIKPADKEQWVSDKDGLRLLVKSNGNKFWRLKYWFAGKQKTLALGSYPETPLSKARELTMCPDFVDQNSFKKSRVSSKRLFVVYK